ncbi:SurA N-terminal domain-containing protein [Desulfohalobiaceae bacterium Ax17]|uniref:SurA N-terminal domain-containing protein n=1 Tax=Desulfovulcanus ferrireducens TaxID=2831190 RepID=UPI00207B9907|nr:SurA N-terminal domain-containing protein [Desulfovulcanus ferrireducens]MBT8763165.1 SurA N-terminal domain-containing protein [Desulfovulcanus ferrireducens]
MLKKSGFYFCLFLCLFIKPVFAEEIIDRIVAIVNGEIITLFELNERVKPYLERFKGKELGPAEKQAIRELKKQLLDQMINDILLRQEAEKYKIEVSDMEIENFIRQFKQRNNLTEEQFLNQLKLQGLTREDYKRQVRNNIIKHRLIGAMVKRKVVVTQEEIERYYNEHKQDFDTEKKVHLKLILLPTLEEAKQIRNKIMAGEMTFEQAAKKFSQGPSAESGGDLGFVNWKDLAKEWKQAIKGLKQGEITSVFSLNNKGAILKVEESLSGQPKPLKEVEDEIRKIIYQPRLEERFREYMRSLREKAVIDIRI